MAHVLVPAAEEVLDKKFPVLDHGFVVLTDYLGGDERIADAARISYGAGTRSVRKDRGLIRYLMRNRHTSPFEQVELVFIVKLPLFVARQWIRHRTAHVNEYSGRYSVMPQEFYIPDVENVRAQSTTNRQGRGEGLDPETQRRIGDILQDAAIADQNHYQDLLDTGLARETARQVLPVSVYTKWYWKIDLHNLLHFLGLRMEHHAQWEIRQYANILYDLAQRVAPNAVEAFDDFRTNAVSLSAKEVGIVQDLLGQNAEYTAPTMGEARRRAERLELLGITVHPPTETE